MISSREPDPAISHVASISQLRAFSGSLQPGMKPESGRKAKIGERQCDSRRVKFTAVRILLERVRGKRGIACPGERLREYERVGREIKGSERAGESERAE